MVLFLIQHSPFSHHNLEHIGGVVEIFLSFRKVIEHFLEMDYLCKFGQVKTPELQFLCQIS